MPSILKILCALVCALFFFNTTQASHYLGGEMTYQNLGNNKYRISATIYRDCIHGDPKAIMQDNPFAISIFNAQTGIRIFGDSITAFQTTIIPVNPISGCLNDTNAYCLNMTKFEKIITLPSQGTYYVVNQRCCFAEDIFNLYHPGQYGLTLSCKIYTDSITNSSAVFNTMPPVRLCINTNFEIDNTATDSDGDSLAYRFVPALDGGTVYNAKPIPVMDGVVLAYSQTFSYNAPLNGSGIFNLNSHTGKISGICNVSGEYFASVACDEYRNGLLINTVVRHFTYAIENCNREVSALVARDTILQRYSDDDSLMAVNCGNGHNISLQNESTGATSYLWDFGVPNTTSDTSTATNPQFTYPAPGRYPVTLIAYGQHCNDTLVRYVLVTDETLTPDFTMQGMPCIYDTLLFTDNSLVNGVAGGLGIRKSIWGYDNKIASGSRANIFFTSPGQNTITHVIISAATGCVASVTNTLAINAANIFVGNDTSIMQGTSLQLQATGGVSYVWASVNPNEAIINPNSDIITVSGGMVGTNQTYYVIGTDATGCKGIDSITISVSSNGYVIVPNAFTPNNDGLNDVLKVFVSNYKVAEFRIFNRRGQEVFYTTESIKGWDGSFKGGDAPMDVYLWTIKAYDAANNKTIFKGNVTLIR